jgi:cytochrome d ubiquinol oxidase subunit II
MTILQTIWWLLIGVLLTGYAVLDGFDLGAGFWHLFAKKDEDRRLFLNAIGPVWDGNEVWLLTGGGAMFAAFPPVYASVFSGMYLALMLVLFGLILRAVSIEFRSHLEDERWRRVWDVAFTVGTMIPALLFGVALGNVLAGMELAPNGDYLGGFFHLLNPYALLIGVLGLAMIVVHGGLYLAMKTEGDIAARIGGGVKIAWWVYLALFLVAGLVTFIFEPRMMQNFLYQPLLFLAPLGAMAAIVSLGVELRRGQITRAFVASALAIVGLMATAGASLFPNLVPSSDDFGLSLTLYNSSSSYNTLKVMLIIAVVFMPLVIGYTIWIYRTFRGKTTLVGAKY